ncbi:hypothetical protein ACQY1Q_02630 [Tenacibaculum sp. TC6]|uniref:hypothetical protein n=1 Tax=Tenacibaculum sp. TC6 TaxID=3423223 RepID=UPI003D359C20
MSNKKSEQFKSKHYLLAPQASTTTVLTLTSGSIYLSDSTEPKTSLQLVSPASGASQEFYIAASSEYAEGYITITYNTGVDITSTAECHLNFFLENTSWNQDTSGSFPNDTTTIIAKSSTKPSPSSPTLLVVTEPTGQKSSGVDSLYQVLNPEMVFLVDYYPENKTMLFRGNTPFDAPATDNGKQTVDFKKLHDYMEAKYVKETGKNDFPAFNTYNLRDICLQSQSSEGNSILWELESFGGKELSQLKGQVWYPSDKAEPQNQMCNWEIQPHNQPSNDVFDIDAVQKLSSWMSPKTAPDIFNIYYIHCASGHDRTGIVASAYMIANRKFSLKRSLIYGTTIAKLSSGSGQLQVNCKDLDGKNIGNIDSDRSRIQMIANVYDKTVLNIYNTLNPKATISELPQTALDENPSYVYSTYPWEKSL